MDIAEAWLEERGERGGVILPTDADSQVAPNWIAENLAAIEAGADAFLGRINLDGEGKYLPQALHRRGRFEDAYERLLTELSWLLDPPEHNPWPHHATISGASLAITRTAYRSVGRLPRVPLGEDNALVALLSRQDARIRYCQTVHVTTSGRTNGRAPGGCCGHPAHPQQGPGGILRRGPGAVPHRVRAGLMARAVAATAWRRTSCPRSRMGARAWNVSAACRRH
jgi:hypothetical protein